MSTRKNSKDKKVQDHRAILTAFTVGGYKSIANEQRIEIRPLTILSGANSAGKSSMIQPLLLLKQTLTATFDPGALLLDGPNVRLSSADQLVSSIGSPVENGFSLGFELENGSSLKLLISKRPKESMRCREMIYQDSRAAMPVSINPGMKTQDIVHAFPPLAKIYEMRELISSPGLEWEVIDYRGFLDIAGTSEDGIAFQSDALPVRDISSRLERLIHLPGLRGNPFRVYRAISVGATFPGTFEEYTAGVIHEWGVAKHENLNSLNKDLESLGLTWKVEAFPKDDTQVELRVGRLPHPRQGGARDLVSIADVGFGVSQTLPVLVALRAAEPGQLVYLEQPEIHLHPRAQQGLARIIADASKRGVIVIVETHSSLMLRGFQTLAATPGALDPTIVKLHWFSRDDATGATMITAADLDGHGSFGDWPVDFDEVELRAEQAFLDAVETARVHS